jgi:hypothetical protein
LPGDAQHAKRWIEHAERILGDDFDHVVNWLAHRVQHPGEKINHGIIFGGAPGIGKDTLFEPVKYAVGHWNWKEISPHSVMETFNPYLKAVVLRVNETRDLGEVNRFQYYERTKEAKANPPDVLIPPP